VAEVRELAASAAAWRSGAVSSDRPATAGGDHEALLVGRERDRGIGRGTKSGTAQALRKGVQGGVVGGGDGIDRTRLDESLGVCGPLLIRCERARHGGRDVDRHTELGESQSLGALGSGHLHGGILRAALQLRGDLVTRHTGDIEAGNGRARQRPILVISAVCRGAAPQGKTGHDRPAAENFGAPSHVSVPLGVALAPGGSSPIMPQHGIRRDVTTRREDRSRAGRNNRRRTQKLLRPAPAIASARGPTGWAGRSWPPVISGGRC
jgi:hypothetical protein